MLLLVPSDPLSPRRPDPHLAPEFFAARDLGHTVALVDHNVLVGADPLEVERALGRVPVDQDVLYRGWMLRSEAYALLEGALIARGSRMRTSAVQYALAHELPGWYEVMSALTPYSAWTSGVSRGAFEVALDEVGPGPVVLRDYSKSLKRYWEEAMFVPDSADREVAWGVASRFLSLREEDLVGGLVVRQFEALGSLEVRTWWSRGRCVLTGAHPDTVGSVPTGALPLAEVASVVEALGVSFVSVDLALREDGVWRVVELGDGQVSDRPADMDPEVFVSALA